MRPDILLERREWHVQDLPGLQSEFRASLSSLEGPCHQMKLKRSSLLSSFLGMQEALNEPSSSIKETSRTLGHPRNKLAWWFSFTALILIVGIFKWFLGHIPRRWVGRRVEFQCNLAESASCQNLCRLECRGSALSHKMLHLCKWCKILVSKHLF